MADTMNYTEVWESAHGQAFSRYIAAPFQLTGTTNKASEVVHYSAGGFSWAEKQCSAGSAAGWCLQASAGSAPWRAGEEVCAATSVCLSAISFLFAHVNIHTSPVFLDLSNSGFFLFFFSPWVILESALPTFQHFCIHFNDHFSVTYSLYLFPPVSLAKMNLRHFWETLVFRELVLSTFGRFPLQCK